MTLKQKKEMVKNPRIGYANLLFVFLSGGRVPKDTNEAKKWFNEFREFVQN